MKKIIITAVLLSLLTSTPAQAATKPLNTKQNKASCTYVRANYKANVLKDWNENLATDADLLIEMDNNIKALSSKIVVSNGAIKTHISSMLTAEKKMKASLTNSDVDGFLSGMNNKLSAVTKLDKACSSIGK